MYNKLKYSNTLYLKAMKSGMTVIRREKMQITDGMRRACRDRLAHKSINWPIPSSSTCSQMLCTDILYSNRGDIESSQARDTCFKIQKRKDLVMRKDIE